MTFTWKLAVKIKILIYNRSIFPAGTQKDHLSELVCAQTRPTKLSVLAWNGQVTPPAFAGCPVHPLPLPRSPALGRQERAPRPGLTWWDQSEQQLCLVLCRVTGLRPLWTWTRDTGIAGQVWHQAGLGAPSHLAAPRPKAPCSPRGRPLDSILFWKLLYLPRWCLKKTS